MNSFITQLKDDVKIWREESYRCDIAEVGEILNFQFLDIERTNFKYLRKPQFETIETYFYLRVKKGTKSILDLYKEYFPDHNILLNELGIQLEQEDLVNLLSQGGIENVFEEIKNNDDFVKKYKLEILRESFSLPYPSYILALVMGAGKSVLIGAIIYVEFALSLITRNNIFLKNALVFAPGKTIIGSLKEIASIPLEKILPQRFFNIVNANLKITYTQDGDKDIPVIKGSNYNIIITNIEKIRITSKKVKRDIYNYHKRIDADEKENIANLRLQTLSSLENLGVFSDEAHNTYGLQLEKTIKKVRQTINYLAETTNLKVVINTTGTPYFKKKILKDVVFWYGLLEGIKEGILKDVRDNIYSYSEVGDENFLEEVLKDFFNEYRDIEISGGYKSKIAIYFPRIEDVERVQPFVEKKIIELGLDISSIFTVNSKSSESDRDIFINRINDKNLPYRVFLLVGMGKEGWNCPSLFACCLARDLGNSSNFVLQASTRCLRQIENNKHSARIYLSQKNEEILNKQLKETYGEESSINNLQNEQNNYKEIKITLRKYDEKLPKIKIKKTRKTYLRKEKAIVEFKLNSPQNNKNVTTKRVLDFSEEPSQWGLYNKSSEEITLTNQNFINLFTASQKLSLMYSLDYFVLKEKLAILFPSRELNSDEFKDIQLQIEEQVSNYQEKTEEVEINLTIIKKEGFDEEENEKGTKVYTTRILVRKEKLKALLRNLETQYQSVRDLSFHYAPYKFDSQLESNLFDDILEKINGQKGNVKHFFFIGGITDKNKTDLAFEYEDKNGIFRNYTPDFLIIKENGEMLFLETKGQHLAEEFKVKESYFKNYLRDKLQFKLLVSESSHITQEDKNFIDNYLNSFS